MNLTIGAALFIAAKYFGALETEVLKDEYRNSKSKIDPNNDKTFDFIIVGGGTAGCVVANRLSKYYSVLILEAGGEPPPLASIIPFVLLARDIKPWNFYYKTVPQKQFFNTEIRYTLGKMLGGSSSVNGAIWNRGNKYDYDNWANITKDKSWNWENTLKRFKKIENYMGIFKSDLKSKGGPIRIETSITPLLPIWKSTAEYFNKYYGDPNIAKPTGFSPIEIAAKYGRRINTYNSYIQPYISNRKKLVISKYSKVEKVIFKGTKAIGVYYKRHKKLYKVFSKYEVILSASTMETPLILFKSGIGPAEHLKAAGIPVRLDLPIGKTFLDQSVFGLEFKVDDAKYFSLAQENLTESKLEHFLRGHSINELTKPPPDAEAYFSSSVASGPPDWPDMKIEVETGIKHANKPLLVLGMNRYKATGTLKLDSKKYNNGERNSFKILKIDQNLFGKEDDKIAFIEGAKYALEIINSPPFKKIGASYTIPKNCTFLKRETFEYYRCIFSILTSECHFAGTCKMGYGEGDINAVTDNKLRVRGTEGLRIVDASVIPVLPNTNPYPAIVNLAERGSEMKINLILN